MTTTGKPIWGITKKHIPTRIIKRSVRPSSGQSIFRIVLLSTIFIGGIAAASMIGRHFVVLPDAPAPADRYSGVVQLAPDNQGRCQQFEFDNHDGSMRPKLSTSCNDIDAPPTSSVVRMNGNSDAPSAGSVGRMNGISDYFKSH